MAIDIEVHDVESFILGGHSEFTIKNTRSRVAYKYRVSQAKKNKDIFYVRVADGSSYQYVGFIAMRNGTPVYAKGERGLMTKDHPAIKGLMWSLKKGHTSLPQPMVMYHHGKCACCGKRLDDPDSVIRGIGPVCWENLKKRGMVH